MSFNDPKQYMAINNQGHLEVTTKETGYNDMQDPDIAQLMWRLSPASWTRGDGDDRLVSIPW